MDLNESKPAFPTPATNTYTGLTKLEYMSCQIAKAIIGQEYLEANDADDINDIADYSVRIARKILEQTKE